jgi:outer membrane protein OmpA-like peptidoglycan-associated protein
VFFDYISATLKPIMLKMFDQLEYFIKQNKNNKIKIGGFTDDIGIYDYN